MLFISLEQQENAERINLKDKPEAEADRQRIAEGEHLRWVYYYYNSPSKIRNPCLSHCMEFVVALNCRLLMKASSFLQILRKQRNRNTYFIYRMVVLKKGATFYTPKEFSNKLVKWEMSNDFYCKRWSYWTLNSPVSKCGRIKECCMWETCWNTQVSCTDLATNN